MKVLIPLPVTRQLPPANAQTHPVDGWGLEMPVGSRILSVRVDPNNSLQAMVLAAPNALRVWHPLLVMPLMGNFTPLVGRDFGKSFGVVMLGPQPFVVFADTPWPESALEGIKLERANG